MNYTELNTLVDKIITAYPTWNPDARRGLLIEKLQDLDATRAYQGVDDLICGFNGQYPTMNNILEAIRVAKVTQKATDCPSCDNTGWIEVDGEGHGSVARCECKGHNLKRFHEGSDLTYDGKPIATKEEKVAAFYRGLNSYFTSGETDTLKSREDLLELTSEYCNVSVQSVDRIITESEDIF